MKIATKAMVAGLVLFATNPSFASGINDGNDLLRECNEAIRYSEQKSSEIDKASAAHCLGIMSGIVTLNNIYIEVLKLEKEAMFCPPGGGISSLQATRIVVKYLKEHPDDLHIGGVVLSTLALNKAFPCK